MTIYVQEAICPALGRYGSQEVLNQGLWWRRVEAGLSPKFQNSISTNKLFNDQEQIFRLREQQFLMEAVYQTIDKKAVTPVQ